MLKGTEYIKEIVHTQNADRQINCGFVQKEDLATHYLALSKDYTYDNHTNVYNITNTNDMKEQGSYLLEWDD